MSFVKKNVITIIESETYPIHKVAQRELTTSK